MVELKEVVGVMMEFVNVEVIMVELIEVAIKGS